jgi:glycosyltransferase involved in cell wall biosynthesis
MRVLMLNYEFPPVGGGAGRATWHLCRELPALGIEVDALVSSGCDIPEDPRSGARIFDVPTHRRGFHETGVLAMLEYLWRAMPLARRLLAERDHDIVHYFFSVPTGLLSFVLGPRKPYVVSLRGGDVPGFNPGVFETAHRLLAPLNRRVLRDAAAAVALSDALKRCARELLGSGDIAVIGNGVDVAQFSPVADGAADRKGDRLLYVGRLIALKGLDDLLGSLSLLPRHFVLDLVGGGAEENALRRRCETLGLSDRVRFLGPRPHESLPAIYRSADIFVIPSVAESFSQVTAEALASGLPVVAANAGALPDLVCHGENGLLVELRSPRAIADAVQAIAGDADRRRRMGEAARRGAVGKLSWAVVARAYAEVYARCLAGRSARTSAISRGGTASTT